MKTYEEMISAPYDDRACIEAYRALLKKPKDIGLVLVAWEATLPILNCVLWTQFRGVQPGTETYDEAISSVSIKIYNYLMSDRFYEKYYDDPKSHFSLLFTICRSEVITAINKVKRYETVDMSAITPSIVDGGHGAIEHKIFVKQLPTYILAQIETKIRFTGAERDLCTFLAERLILGKGIPVPIIRNKWGTRNLRFFADYVRVLVRSILYVLKPDIDAMPSIADTVVQANKDASEQEMFTEGLRWNGNWRSKEEWWLSGYEPESVEEVVVEEEECEDC